MSQLETYSGLMYDYKDPKPEQIDWDEVFHVLSGIARFAGHTARPYSVGEHVLLVADLVAAAGGTQEQVLAGLHHDTHEVYFGDIPSPLKHEIKERAPGLWESLTEPCDSVIRSKLGLQPGAFADKIVKKADTTALRLEAYDLKASRGLTPYWGWDQAPAEIAYFQIAQIMPSQDLIKARLRERHDALTTGALALAA